MLDADTGNIYKKVAILRIFQRLYKQTNQSISPTCKAMQSALSFDMLHLIIYAIENREFCNMKNWKLLTELVILNLEYKCWEFTLKLYGNMKIYKNVMQNDGLWSWWRFSRKKTNLVKHCQMLLRLLSGCRLHEFETNRSKCCLCDVLFNDRASHVLFDCVGMRQSRDTEWQRVNSTMPPAISIEFERMSITEGTLYIAKGSNGSYIQEWDELYVAVLRFIKVMYIDFMCKMDNK